MIRKSGLIIASFVALATILLAPPAHAEGCPGRSFIGLWEGIDPADGGHQIVSIRQEGDCSFKLLLRDTFLTVCGGTDQGLSSGTGRLDKGVLRTDDLTLTCFNNGKKTSFASTFDLDRKQWILIRDRAVLTPIVIYHRTSNR